MRTPHHRIDVIPLFLVRSADGFCSIPKILSVFRLIGCQTGTKVDDGLHPLGGASTKAWFGPILSGCPVFFATTRQEEQHGTTVVSCAG